MMGSFRCGRHLAKAVGTFLFGLTISSCGQVDPPQSPTSIGSTRPVPPVFQPRTNCLALSDYIPPEAGTIYTYAREDGSRSSREILTSSNGIVHFQYRRAGDNGPLLPPRQAIAGLFVSHDAAANRRIVYGVDPLHILEALSPGATATIPTTETSKIRGREKRIDFPTTVRFRSCGLVPVEGRSIPVRVYDISTARRVVDRSGNDDLRYSAVTYYLSAETGYPIIFQDSETTTAISIGET